MSITIVGSGFGGVKAALLLAKNKKNKIVLITNSLDFQYYPALYKTATGYSPAQSWIELDTIFHHVPNVTIVIDTIRGINKQAKQLTGESGMTYDYNTLILSLGTVTTYFGIEGLESFAFGIKSPQEIQRLRQHLYTEFVREHAVDKRYIIVGAGPTGVELSAALRGYLEELRVHHRIKKHHIHVEVVEAAPRVMPRMSEYSSRKIHARLQKLGVRVRVGEAVQSQTADTLMVSGEPIATKTVVWTSGVATNPFYKANEASFTFAKNGKIEVDEFLRADPHIYILGDNAATPYSGLAQTAISDARYVAKAITAFSRGAKPHAYKPKLPPVVIPVGENWAAFEWKKIKITGLIASLIRMAADLVGYSEILPLGEALHRWRSQRVKTDGYYTPKTLE